MYSRMVLTLTSDERTALVQLAASQDRYPDQQMRHLLREAAQARGLLPRPTTNTNDAPLPEKREGVARG